MSITLKKSIPDSPAETLAEIRRHIDRHPAALHSEPERLSEMLKAPVIEVEAAIEWLLDDGLEVRA